MRVFVAGGTGVIGRRLLALLARAGHEVTALTRSQRRAEEVRARGVQPVIGDALDAARLREAVMEATPEVVINQLTNIPKRLNPRRSKQEMAATNRLRLEATRTLVGAAQAAGVRRVISQSISFVYDPTGAALATEDEPLYHGAPVAFRDLVRAIDASERTVLDAEGVEGVVLRYGWFYGPGTIYASDGSFAEDVRRRRVPIVGDGEGVSSFIHVDDAAAATVLALEHGEPGAYNVVDDDPAPVRVWLPAYAQLLGAPRPFRVPKFVGRLGAGPYGLYFMTEQRGAWNEKAKTRLRWKPRYPSWREGFASNLAA